MEANFFSREYLNHHSYLVETSNMILQCKIMVGWQFGYLPSISYIYNNALYYYNISIVHDAYIYVVGGYISCVNIFAMTALILLTANVPAILVPVVHQPKVHVFCKCSETLKPTKLTQWVWMFTVYIVHS